MCDPVSIGLTIAGSAASYFGNQQSVSAQKKDIASTGQAFTNYMDQSSANHEAERGTQNDAFATNQGTVGDTLSTYSLPNQQSTWDAATAKRSADYTNPLQAMSFSGPVVADADANSAVSNRNATTASTAKATSLGEALAKAKLDGYGDARTQNSIHAAGNAQDINVVDQNAARSQQAANTMDAALNQQANNTQGLLSTKLAADQTKGAGLKSLGDLLTAAGSLTSGAGGLGSLGGMSSGALTASSPLVPGLGTLSLPSLTTQGTGLLGKFGSAFG